jgi:hypothetical protein
VRSRCVEFIADPGGLERARADDAREKELRHVVELHHHAQAAARADDCAIVKRIAARIRELDAAYYSAEVADDGLLARCLAP